MMFTVNQPRWDRISGRQKREKHMLKFKNRNVSHLTTSSFAINQMENNIIMH